MKKLSPQTIYEILRFLVVGVLATLADFLVYSLFFYFVFMPIKDVVWHIGLLQLSPQIVSSTIIGFSVGVIVNYLLSIYFVFKNVANQKTSRSVKGFMIFLVLGIIGLLINIGIKELGNLILPLQASFWWNAFVFAGATGVVLVYNYISRKLILFKPKTAAE